ncbi:MAG: hypothetical protein ACRDUA_08870 [Micromonosporaceae bacterium]
MIGRTSMPVGFDLVGGDPEVLREVLRERKKVTDRRPLSALKLRWRDENTFVAWLGGPGLKGSTHWRGRYDARVSLTTSPRVEGVLREPGPGQAWILGLIGLLLLLLSVVVLVEGPPLLGLAMAVLGIGGVWMFVDAARTSRRELPEESAELVARLAGQFGADELKTRFGYEEAAGLETPVYQAWKGRYDGLDPEMVELLRLTEDHDLTGVPAAEADATTAGADLALLTAAVEFLSTAPPRERSRVAAQNDPLTVEQVREILQTAGLDDYHRRRELWLREGGNGAEPGVNPDITQAARDVLSLKDDGVRDLGRQSP